MPPGTKSKTRPPPPPEIEGEALLEWERVCNELDSLGQLATTDRAVLTLYVQTWAVFQKATEGIVKHGPVIKLPNQIVCASPFYNIQKESGKQLRGLLCDLGLTPTTRTGAGDGTDEPLNY